MKSLWLAMITVTLLCPISCSRKSTAVRSSRPIPAGSLMDDKITFVFAIYYLPVPSNDPIATLDALVAERYADIRKVPKLDSHTETLGVFSEVATNGAFTPPDLGSLKYFGRGLSREQALALQDSKVALVLGFSCSKEHVWDGMRSALKLTVDVARRTGGILWDDETREAFTPEAWETNRLVGWDTGVLDISKHTVIHSYRREEAGFVRAITLGMVKFGLPDVVIEDFSWADADHIGYLINFFAQAMAEGATVVKTGEFDLDLRAIRNYGLREPQLASLKSNATAKALLSLRKGRRDEGDPPNRLIEIAFDRYPGPDLHARQEALLSTLFGWEDSVNVRGTRHSDALLAASRRAREKLPGLREQFNTKMRPGEYILVKVPFPTLKDGDEYMWVEVASWSGDKMKGLLKNEPVYVPMLHAGQMVQVSESKVFDYIHVLPDGTQEGNETGRIIEAQSR